MKLGVLADLVGTPSTSLLVGRPTLDQPGMDGNGWFCAVFGGIETGGSAAGGAKKGVGAALVDGRGCDMAGGAELA
jgi:hypothetical protein